MSQYYFFLGKSLILKKGKKFWSYHFDQAKKIGIELNKFKIKFFMVIEIMRLTLSPIELVEKISNRVRRKNKPDNINQFSWNSITSEDSLPLMKD